MTSDKETETYMFNGQQLTPVAHRGELQDRQPEKIFHTRVEGGFQKIVRHGSSPKNYWWEVTDKNGTKYFYGGNDTEQDSNAILAKNPGSTPVFRWMLRKTMDANGNTITYEYDRVCDTGVGVKGNNVDGDETCEGGVAGYQLYIKTIRYTGYENNEGAYSVIFTRDKELDEDRRPDVLISGKPGFKAVTAALLRKVKINYQQENIRTYDISYDIGRFGKSLVKEVTQYDYNNVVFNQHKFDYYDEVKSSTALSVEGFESAKSWVAHYDDVRADDMSSGVDKSSAIESSFSSSTGGLTYFGLGVQPGKDESSGQRTSYNHGASQDLLSLTDINGDGLPDKLFKGGKHGPLHYRLNQSGPDGSFKFSEDTGNQCLGISGLSVTKSSSSVHGSEHWGDHSDLKDRTRSRSNSIVFPSDINGDGILDVVAYGNPKFGYLNNGSISFSTDSSLTPVEIAPGRIDKAGFYGEPDEDPG